MYRIKEGCPGCGSCEGICPVNAIVPGNSLGMEITDACINCGLCAQLCPINLIEALPATEAAQANNNYPDQTEGGLENA